MNSMLATDATDPAGTAPEQQSLLETWGKNERMRHVPTIEWIIAKLDVDLRARIGKVVAVYTAMAPDDPRHGAVESDLRLLSRAIDRLADAARHVRGNHHAPPDLPSRLTWAINHAVSSLGAVDADLFGRRYPFQTHERSKSEATYGALLVVMQAVERVGVLARAIDPGFDSPEERV
jgi:hypothetical protein